VFSIISHMIGGTTAIVGFFLGILTGSKIFIAVALFAGTFLHTPTVVVQLRSTHGRREMITPLYVAVVAMLWTNYLNVVTRNADYDSVYSAAQALTLFTWVRLWGALFSKITHTDASEVHDRALIFSGFAKAPFVYGRFCGFLMILLVLFWNAVFEYLRPVPRSLLQVNRAYNDIFPDTFNEKHSFTDLVREIVRNNPKDDPREISCRAAFIMLADDGADDDPDSVSVESLTRLLLSWGLPNARNDALGLLARSDANNDGHISYDEFKQSCWFIWQNLYMKGEYVHDEYGIGKTLKVSEIIQEEQDKKNSKKND